jgi:signal transduction histidine kinase/ActR/RegA family two-component response regulator
MTELGHELFLLMVTLSQLRDSRRTMELFAEALGGWSEDVDLQLHYDSVAVPGDDLDAELERVLVPVETAQQRFATLELRYRHTAPAGTLELLRNAARMLALILEKQARDAQGEAQRAALEQAVGERTEHLEQARAQLQRELSASEALTALSQELAEELGPITIAEHAASAAQRLTGAAFVIVAAVDNEQRVRLSARAGGDARSYGFAQRTQMGLEEELDPKEIDLGLWRWPLLNKKELLTNDAAEHEAFAGHCKRSLLQRALAVPVLSGGRPLGLIAVANPAQDDKPRDFDAQDLALIRRLAELFAGACERQLWREERARLEQQLRQTQKMEAIGTLAGGIAHDFNNLLMAIIGFTELAHDSVEDQEVREDLSGALEATGRARDLIRQLLAFSRRSEPQPEPLSLPDVCEQVLRMVRATLPTSVEIEREWPLEPLIVLADRVQLEQVLVNLCTNASQAMPEGGRLEVTVTPTVLSDGDLQFADLLPGSYVRLAVRDTGVGMDAQTIERVFEPYFTTKDGGSGIGLAVVHGIVRDHGGALHVDSEVGVGTCFQIVLPRAEEDAREHAEQVEIVQGRGERLLFVDDEPLLAALGARSLERLGYQVVAETDPRAALVRFRAAPNDFDLVLTDQTMPKLSGARLLQALRATRPTLPIVLMTGYSEHLDAERARQLGASAFVLKPLRLAELSHTLRALLGPSLN